MTDDTKIQDQENTKAKKQVSKGVEKLVDEISKLTVLELSELVEALQDKLGVSAMPMAAAASAVNAAPADAGAESDDAVGGGTKTVVITKAGDNKIAVIKAIREIDQNIGLKEAKDMTETLPAEVAKDLKAEDAKSAKEKLEAAGCTVELK